MYEFKYEFIFHNVCLGYGVNIHEDRHDCHRYIFGDGYCGERDFEGGAETGTVSVKSGDECADHPDGTETHEDEGGDVNP